MSVQASVSLADEIILATATMGSTNVSGNSLPTNPELANYEALYWAAMSNGTGEGFTAAYNGLTVDLIGQYFTLPGRCHVSKYRQQHFECKRTWMCLRKRAKLWSGPKSPINLQTC